MTDAYPPLRLVTGPSATARLYRASASKPLANPTAPSLDPGHRNRQEHWHAPAIRASRPQHARHARRPRCTCRPPPHRRRRRVRAAGVRFPPPTLPVVPEKGSTRWSSPASRHAKDRPPYTIPVDVPDTHLVRTPTPSAPVGRW